MRAPNFVAPPARLFAGAVVALCATGLPANALVPENLQGYLDVTVVQSTVDGVRRDTVRQEYTSHWSKIIVPYVTTRASLRYSKFDLRDNQTSDLSREELQPSAELMWRHPKLTFSSNIRRRNARLSNQDGRQINDHLALALTTRDSRMPRVTLRYDLSHVFDRDTEMPGRDTRDKRFQLGLDHSMGGQTFAYHFTRRRTENVVSTIESSEFGHLFRWAGPNYRPNERVRLNSSYTFSYRQQTDRQTGEGAVLAVIRGAAGLYSDDPSPEFGTLVAAPTLSDLNTSDRAEPTINIGGALDDRNLGLDLRFERPVSVVYVYTDRPSGPELGWDVFVSGDNAAWERPDGIPVVEFNTSVNRYEVTFRSATARYVKVVNTGVNDVEEVFVTEIEALQVLGQESSVTNEGGAHLLDVGANYAMSENWSSSIGVSYENEPFSLVDQRRSRTDYTVGARYRQHPMVLHTARWQQGHQTLGSDIEDEDTSSISYVAQVDPLETLRFTGSLSARRDRRGGVESDDVDAALVRATGSPIPGLSVSSEVSRTRTEQHGTGRRQDTWNYRSNAEGPIVRSLSASVSFLHQRTRLVPEEETRARNRYGVDFDYRMTRAILVRGSYSLTDDRHREITQDYVVSWNATPKLRMGAVASLNDAGVADGTHRYNANVTYDLSSRSTIYWTYNTSDLTGAGGTETTSFQSGLRATF